MQVEDENVSQSLQKLALWAGARTARAPFSPLEVPSSYERLTGILGTRSLLLETRRFAHPALLHVTLAILSEGDTVLAVTLYALPRPDSVLPILGLDYVAFGEQLSLAALDLAPMDQVFWEDRAKPLLMGLQADMDGLLPRELPEFAAKVFSPIPLLVGAKTPAGCNRAVGHAISVLEAYFAWLESPPVAEIARPARLKGWCRAMASNKKESGALSRIFGPIAEDYLRAYLFSA